MLVSMYSVDGHNETNIEQDILFYLDLNVIITSAT